MEIFSIHIHIHIPAELVLISESVTGADSAICVVTGPFRRLPTCGSSWVGTVTVEVVDSIDSFWCSLAVHGAVW